MSMHTPAQKQTDPTRAPGVVTLGDYIKQKVAHEPKKLTFEEWWAIWYGCYTEDINSPLKYSMQKAWEAAQKNV